MYAAETVQMERLLSQYSQITQVDKRYEVFTRDSGAKVKALSKLIFYSFPAICFIGSTRDKLSPA
jgi:hypothetical protein